MNEGCYRSFRSLLFDLIGALAAFVTVVGNICKIICTVNSIINDSSLHIIEQSLPFLVQAIFSLSFLLLYPLAFMFYCA